MNELKYLYYWNKKSWAKKRNRQLIWTSRYEQNSLISILFISCRRLETISINVHKRPVECFECIAAPRRRPPRYHDHFDAVFPVLMHYLLFHYRDHPGHRRRQGGLGEHIVILCLERRYPKQNSVVCLKPSALPPPQFFWPLPNFWDGYATDHGIHTATTVQLLQNC